MSQLRVFLALPLSAGLRQAAAGLQRQLAAQLPEVRWSPSEQMHLTLHFFGELPEEQVEIVRASMLSIGRQTAPFSLAFGTPGVFPSPARARVLWLGLADPVPVCRLQARLGTALQQAGVALEERTFRPHLTLGRWRTPRRLPALDTLRQALPAASMQVDRIILLSSTLRPEGVVHTPLADIPLTGPG